MRALKHQTVFRLLLVGIAINISNCPPVVAKEKIKKAPEATPKEDAVLFGGGVSGGMIGPGISAGVHVYGFFYSRLQTSLGYYANGTSENPLSKVDVKTIKGSMLSLDLDLFVWSSFFLTSGLASFKIDDTNKQSTSVHAALGNQWFLSDELFIKVRWLGFYDKSLQGKTDDDQPAFGELLNLTLGLLM